MSKTNWSVFNGWETLQYWCPGCEEAHAIRVRGLSSWQWNGDMEKPDIQPSIKVTHHDGRICHCHIVHGMIQFCNDCFHALSGQTVEIPERPY